jgi:hypothetical protein
MISTAKRVLGHAPSILLVVLICGFIAHCLHAMFTAPVGW